MTIPKTALVTGAGRRIGRAIALDLARHGWTVCVHYNRSRDEADDVVAEIGRDGGSAVALGADLAREDAVVDLARRAVDALGPIGCLVNNASRFEPDDIGSMTRQSWDAHLEANLRAPLVLTQQMAASLPQDAEGVVVNIIDQRVWNLTPHFLSYTVSKSGLWTLTRTLALALAPRIRVNGIGPGPTLPSTRQSEPQFRRQYESMPLQRHTTEVEICNALRFIIDARSMTGQMIALDAGQHLGWTQPGPNDPNLE